ncbi:unnamed protein product [Aphanomyces euteiches]|uniref:B30.2/SPRY domain-containing protein n=1 Tax=Aphanomyces euteiches TaxID=100861 RepID=A0A6G0WGM7_9STRA|nr:hypothetical protein Ae201684_015405 [Aphanomyces euteiches]KAH9097550.1 hypothetical protein Ae201684P_001028 [Aphanomyces euteiches]KAH9143014.1 hypothetical protein AeRB84_012957 [Aphanomyces euteiches]
MWVATPLGLAQVNGESVTQDGPVEVQFPWGGRGYIQRHQVSPSFEFQCSCFAATPWRFALTLSLEISLTALRERVIEHLQVALHIDNIVVMQPSVGGAHVLTETTKCVFVSLRPLLIHVFPILPLGKSSSVLHIEGVKDTPSALTTESADMNPSQAENSPVHPPKSFVLDTAAASRSIKQIGRGHGVLLGREDYLLSGRKYWEIRLDTEVMGDGVFIGVASCDIALSSSVVGSGLFWGYAAHLGKTIDLAMESFGEPCVQGDVVGILYDVDRGLLTFYRNGRPLGTPFRNVFGRRLCPAISMTHVGLQCTLLPSTVPPPVDTM